MASRWTRWLQSSFVVLFALAFFTGVVAAQNPAANSSDTAHLTQQIQKQLGGLSNYGVFDWITFKVHDNDVLLQGFASRPSLKSDAGRVVKKISGVQAVDNQIEVLPLSRNDDRVRVAVYDRIYTFPSLRVYNANQGRYMQAIGPIAAGQVRMGGSVVNYPPIGFNGIHIIVRNGNVTLYGVVNNEGDKSAAGLQANSAPGTFKVTNDLIVAPSSKKK